MYSSQNLASDIVLILYRDSRTDYNKNWCWTFTSYSGIITVKRHSKFYFSHSAIILFIRDFVTSLLMCKTIELQIRLSEAITNSRCMNFKMFFLLGSLMGASSFTLFSNVRTSDSTKYNKISVNAGYYNLGSIDELYSHTLYSGANVAYGLKFIDGNNRKNHQLAFRYATIERTPKNVVLDASLFPVDDFNLLKRSFLFEAFDAYRFIIDKASVGTFRLYATGSWFTTVNINTNAKSLPELIESGLGAGLYGEKNLNKHKLRAEFAVPLITWTVRNNYSLSMTQNYEKQSKLAFIVQNSQLQFPNSLLAIFSTVGYEYALSNHFNIEGEYHFRYMLNTSPRPLRSVAGIYSLGLTYQF